jgi:DNA ligase 1
MGFQLLQKMINELNESNSTLDKIKTLSKPEYNNDFIKEVLKATHNPFKQYYVTPKNLKKRSELVASGTTFDLFGLLNVLSARKITGHEAISEVNAFINQNAEYAEIIYNIFDRNLKTRVSEKIINKVFPNLIPTFEVALANKFDEKMSKRIDFTKEDWYASRKLDGLRCICIVDENGIVTIYSRSGLEFFTLDVIKREVETLNLTNIVLDGEICIINGDKEDFQAILKEYNKKNHTIKNPRFKIFDILDLNQFLNRKGNVKLSTRNNQLKYILSSYEGNSLNLVDQWKVKSPEHLVELTAWAEKQGWEGIMIRKDANYEGKRSNNLLKCKKFFDAEYTVTKTDIGPFRVIVDGLEVTENMLRNVTIEHKGYEVSVGSGFSIEQRRFFRDHPEEILGKEITVKYFEETKNQDGTLSLRFPTVKAIYTNGRNI